MLIGVVGVVLATPFAYFMSLTYFQPNPLAKGPFSRLNAYLEVLEMGLRSVLVYLDILAYKTPVARPLILFVFGILLCGYIVTKFPYYRRNVNALRFVVYGILSFGGFLGMISGFIFEDNGEHTAQADGFAITFFVVCPALAFALYHAFQVIYIRKTRSIYTMLIKEVPKGNIDEYCEKIEKLNFLSPYHVELQTRFVRETAIVKRSKIPGKEDEIIYDSRAIMIAAAIYRHGLLTLPKNALMAALYGLFCGVYFEDLDEWRNWLEKAEDSEPSFLDSLLIAQSASEREQTQRKKKNAGAELDALDIIEIKNSIKLARKRSDKVKAYASELWKQMLTNKVDPIRIQKLISKMYINEVAAKKIYDQSLSKYPTSLVLVVDFAKFLDVC